LVLREALLEAFESFLIGRNGLFLTIDGLRGLLKLDLQVNEL
jgi:hypothetical protein